MGIPDPMYFALGVEVICCANVEQGSVYPSVGRPTHRCELCEARTALPVRALLVECETVQPMGFEEVLSDGRSIESGVPTDGPERLRLHVQLENVGPHDLLVANCNGALRVIDVDASRPGCWPLEPPWVSLPGGGTMVTYPTIPKPTTTGIFTETLQPQLGHAPDASWRTHVPDAVFFRLMPTGCQPLSAAEASVLPRFETDQADGP